MIKRNAVEAGLSSRKKVGRLGAWLARSIIRLLRWELVGERPELSKYVLIGAPHTSNWDFLIMLALDYAFKIGCVWMGKDSLFRGLPGIFFRRMGGIPIDRSSSHSVVEQAVRAFQRHDKMVLTISPEGTRGKTRRWRTGFYYIALGAGVPIVLGFVDFERKRTGLGPSLIPSGDIEADMTVIQDFYRGMRGKFPQNAGRVATVPSDL